MIPFDSLSLAVVCDEAQAAVGSNLRKVIQPNETSLLLRLKGPHYDGGLLLSCHPVYHRMFLASVTPNSVSVSDPFHRIVREKLEGGRLLSIDQSGFDRVCQITIGKSDGPYSLMAHFTGTHANLFVVSPARRILAKCRSVGADKIGQPYEPPHSPASSLREAVLNRRGLSKFLEKQLDSIGPEALLERASSGPRVLVPEAGAYCFQPEQTAVGKQFDSLSAALETHFLSDVDLQDHAARRASLVGQLRRALEARKKSLEQMETSLDDAARAQELQRRGELILAYGQQQTQSGFVVASNHEGVEVRIPVDPQKTHVENADRLFKKAKNAKAAVEELRATYNRKQREIHEIAAALSKLEDATASNDNEIEDLAKSRGWFRDVGKPMPKQDREFEGHKIRKTESPSGFAVYWGETATANDYLTTRVARPNDWWLHIRGHTGAHVLLRTDNNPSRVQHDDFEFAAKVAVSASGQKHARHVPVDYTLAKYVRKPRKSAPGQVTYSNEKTVFVDP